MFKRLFSNLSQRKQINSELHDKVSEPRSFSDSGELDDLPRSIDQRLKDLEILRARALQQRTSAEAKTLYASELRAARSSPRAYARHLNNYGQYLAKSGKLISAERALRLAVRYSSHPELTDEYYEYVINYVGFAAEILPPERLKDLRAFLSDIQPGTAAIFESRIAERMGLSAGATAAAKKAVEVLEPHGPSAALFTAKMRLAERYANEGDSRGAIQIGKGALETAEAALGLVPFSERTSVRISIAAAVEFVLSTWVSSGEELTWDALDLAERGKSRSLLERLGEDIMPVSAQLSREVQMKEIEILSELRTVKLLSRHVAPVDRASYPYAESEVRQRLWQHLDSLPAEHRQYADLRKGIPSNTRDCVRSLGPTHPRTHTIVFYALPDHLLRWWIDDSNNLRECVALPITKTSLLQAVADLLNECTDPNSNPVPKAEKLTAQLFGKLLQSIPSGSTLLIIPSGALYNVPFCALVEGGIFLIDRFSFCTLPCLSTLRFWRMARFVPGRLILGDSLGDLRVSFKEAKSVSKSLNAAPLLRHDVVREKIERTLPQCYFLHVACHAFVNSDVPMFSGFYLADRTVLSAEDLARMQLNCRLAFLSGCDTGWVAEPFEDDPQSIGASMLHAGISAVVFTLWNINDFVTKDLVQEFYSWMLRGYSLNRCLREAQLSLLKRPRLRHPFYWAAFQLSGDWAPVAGQKLNFG